MVKTMCEARGIAKKMKFAEMARKIERTAEDLKKFGVRIEKSDKVVSSRLTYLRDIEINMSERLEAIREAASRGYIGKVRDIAPKTRKHIWA